MNYSGGMSELTLQADSRALRDGAQREGLELATLTFYDIPALAALSVAAYENPRTAESLWDATDEMRMYFDGAFGTPRDDSFIGAWMNGELVGAVFAVLDAPFDGVPRGPFVLDLMVDPRLRRQGIGSALVGELATRVGTWGYDDLALQLDMKKSPEALHLYRSLGFSEIPN